MPNWEPTDRQARMRPLTALPITLGGHDNRLLSSPNPIVRRIGAWCVETSDRDRPPEILTFGGLMMGLIIAELYPGKVSEILDSLQSPIPEMRHDNPGIEIARQIVEGDDGPVN